MTDTATLLPAHRAAGTRAGSFASSLIRSRTAILLLLILVAASALRFYRLGEGLWLDEIITDVEYVNLSYREIVTVYDSENQHFLYTLMARAAYDLFGPSPWALRLPAAIFGIGSLLALYLFARRVTTADEALLATALMAFSYHHIWFSQNARGYTGLLFFALMSSWLLLYALQEGRTGHWLGYALTAALGLYTHMTMLFVVAGQALVALGWLFYARPHRATLFRGVLIGFGGAAGVSLLLYAPVLPQLFAGLGREPSAVTAWKSPLWTLGELVRGLNISFGSGLVVLVALGIVMTGLVSYLRRQPAVVVLFVAPVVSGALVVLLMQHHLWPRFFFFAFGFGALVLVRGAFLTGKWLGDRLSRVRPELARFHPGRTAGAVVCLGLILASAVSVPAVYGPKQDYQAALNFVTAQRQPGDAVLTAGIAVLPYKEYYHADWEAIDSIAALDAARARAERTWFVYTFPPVLESLLPDVMASVNQDFSLVASFEGTLNGGTIYVLRADRNAVVSRAR